MGERGPVPKRSDQRRRRNLLDGDIRTGQGATSVEVPDADGDWHPIAIRWFVSLGESGQSARYEPSDWQFACFIAELITRALDNPRGINGQLISAVMSGMTELLTTEGSRLRARIELERGDGVDPHAEHANATVTNLRALRGG